jgi:pentatricopeptide repeat protein
MDQMLQAGLKPSPYTWSILVNGCAKANELDFAESILQEAIERSKNSPLHQKNVLRNVNVQYTRNIAPYETVVPQTIEDLLDKADELLMAGKSVLSSYLFNPLIDAYSKNGNFNRAKELFNKMVELHVPVTVPVYVTLMSMFQNEKRYDAVETMWQALQEPAKHQEFVENIDPNISRIPIPEKYYDHLQLLEITSEQNIQVIEPTEESIPEQASYFALSIYIDSLVQQDRGEEIENLWSQLESKNYQFDEQNWNRYIVSLLGNNKLDKACQIVSEQFLASDSVDEDDENEQDSRLLDKVERSRDKLDIDASNQLHDRTCFAFATRFRIPGAENMGVLRLRSAVIERIKKFLREEQV